MSRGYDADDGTLVRFDRPLKGIVRKKVSVAGLRDSTNAYNQDPNFQKRQTYDGDRQSSRVGYEVEMVDPAGPAELFGKKIIVDHQHVIPDPRDIFFESVGLSLAIANPLSFLDYLEKFYLDHVLALGVGSEASQILKDLYATNAEKFMQPENNPFTRALESTMGRGLAGVLDGINFSWYNNDFTWETDYNSRAPRGVEISFNLRVIHDLPPGIDHSGYNRAPLYNVGEIMKDSVGDAHGDDASAEFEYRRAGNGSFSKTGK
jgi:hypothetical protein